MVTGDPDSTPPFWKAQPRAKQNPARVGGWEGVHPGAVTGDRQVNSAVLAG